MSYSSFASQNFNNQNFGFQNRQCCSGSGSNSNGCGVGFVNCCTNFGGFAYPLPDELQEIRDIQNRLRQQNINDGAEPIRPPAPPVPPGPPVPIADVEARLLELINQFRVTRGCQPLVNNAFISALAEQHSEFLANSCPTLAGDCAHAGFLERDAAIRAEFNGQVGATAENVAFVGGNITPEQAVQQLFQGWINSPEHLINITNCAFDTTGLGVVAVASPEGTRYYATQLFADVL